MNHKEQKLKRWEERKKLICKKFPLIKLTTKETKKIKGGKQLGLFQVD